MVIYQSTISEFIEKTLPKNQDLLVSEIKSNMKRKIGRGVSPSEERSWRTTLRKISSFFENIQNKDDQYILLEFKVPTTQKRIDVILVGSDGVKNTLLIIELKGWSEARLSEIKFALDINAIYGKGVSHPSKEAMEYKEILTEQFSDISKEFKEIGAVSLLPNYELVKNDPLLSSQFKEIINYYQVFTKDNRNEFVKLLSELFKVGIPRSKVEFLNKLEYNPTESFRKHLEEEFKNIKLSLSQELAFNNIVRQIDLHLKNPTNKKLITVSGMPGSGKTIVAFKILAYIYSKKNMTAKLQLPGPEFRDAVKKVYGINDFSNMIGGAYSKSEAEVVIIDEAHKAYGQGTSQQFYKELFAKQNFVISLIDDMQVVNKKGHTRAQVIEKAQDQKFDVINIDLKEQFRNDILYIDWLRNWIFDENNLQEEFVSHGYGFDILEDKEFNSLYEKLYEKDDVRLTSFWTQKWNAEFDSDGKPKRLVKVGSGNYVWNPNDYWVKSFKALNPDSRVPSWFTRDVVKKNFNKDKKGSEYIAYFNTIQGSEFDYIFVHLPKLFYLNDQNKLDVDLSQLDMTDMRTQVWTKKGVPNPDKEELNKLYFKNRLLVNLTRGKKGAFVFCEDQKLQNWIRDKFRK